MSQTVLDAMADNLVKLRRCGLQKQKNVYEDLDVDTFYILGNEEKSVNHDDQPEKTSNCSRNESKEIPRRFLSISSLEPIESETDLSEMMRLEIKKEIRNLSEKIKNLTYQELVSVLTQVSNLSLNLLKMCFCIYERESY